MPHSLSDDGWLIHEQGFSLEKANYYETLFTVGNGYQGTRGSFSEGHKGELSATYLGGVYDHHDSTVIDQVNVTSWLPVTVWVAGQKLDVQNCTILEHSRTLDMQTGVLHRRTLFEDRNGHITELVTARFCSFADQHLACIKVGVTAINHTAELELESALEGERYNLDALPAYKNKPQHHPEVKWQKWAKSRHLEITRNEATSERVYLESVTLDTGIVIGMAAALGSKTRPFAAEPVGHYERVGQRIKLIPQMGETYIFEKFVSIFTSRDCAADEVQHHCHAGLETAQALGFEACLKNSAAVWQQKWQSSDCVVIGDEEATKAARFNIYHMLIAANQNDPRANIGAKSMSGEGYKGHVFWDTEIFLLPFFIFTQPETARALLMYRYNTLKGAIENADSNGFKGAQYPWESADTGLETTPKWTHDGVNRIWTGEEEIHISACVAFGVISYLTATGDWQFITESGAEILAQTSRFWVSRLEHNQAEDRYELTRVIGPDEFHEHIDNNAFTNRMAQWHLVQSAHLLEKMAQKSPEAYAQLKSKISLSDAELSEWIRVSEKIYIPYDSSQNLIEQFSGYFELEDLPITEWDENGMPLYPTGHDHFTLNNTMILKQPDVIMLLYLLTDEFSDVEKATNFEFYEQRTMHKSSLSPAIHCIMGIEVGDFSSAERYFQRSAYVDLIDNQGNTQDGMHIASAGGTWQTLVCGFGGLRVKNGQMTFKPWLPTSWKGLRFALSWRNDTLLVELLHGSLKVELSADASDPVTIEVQGQPVTLQPGKVSLIDLAAFSA